MKTFKSTAVLIILISIIMIPGCNAIRKMTGMREFDRLLRDFYSLVYSDDYDEALNVLDRIESHNDGTEEIITECKCTIAMYTGRYDEALVEANRFLEGERQPRILKIRGDIYSSMHRLDDAREDYETFLDLTRFDLQSQRTLRLIPSTNANLIRLDLEEWQFTDAIELLTKLRTEFPEDRDLYRLEFEFAMKEHNFSDASLALDLYDQSITIDFEESRYIDLYQSGTHLRRAWLEFDEGDLVDARAFLERYHSERPDAPKYYTWNTDFDWALGDFESANFYAIDGMVQIGAGEILRELDIDIPQSIVEPDPEPEYYSYYYATYFLGYIGSNFLASGDPAGTIACAGKMIDLNPYELEAYKLKTYAYLVLGEFENALEACETGLGVSDYEFYLSHAYLTVMSYLDDSSRSRLVEKNTLYKWLEAAHSLWPNDPTYCSELGWLYLYDGDYSKAEELYLTAYQELPLNYFYEINYAIALAHNGHLIEAYAIIDEVESEPDLMTLCFGYITVARSGSSDGLALVDYLREKMDPQNNFDEYLNPFIQSAQEAVSANEE